jgi:pimeloyl-ACP methyl ester carboxylesterase
MTSERDLGDRFDIDDARKQLLARAPVAERRIDLAGVSTAVLEAGDGPPVVLLHGLGAYGAAWLPVIPALARSYRVIAPDLPGQGASVVTQGRLDAGRVLDWLAALCTEISPTVVAMVGHLTGGAIAARFACRHDHLVSRLVLVVPLGLAPFAPRPEFGAALTGYAGEPNEATHDKLWRECVQDLDGLRRHLGDRWTLMRRYNLELVRTAAIAQAQQMYLEEFGTTEISSDVLADLSVPTTLVWGRHDSVVNVSIGETASARYGWPLHVIEAGNEPALEAPDVFVRVAFTPTVR